MTTTNIARSKAAKVYVHNTANADFELIPATAGKLPEIWQLKITSESAETVIIKSGSTEIDRHYMPANSQIFIDYGDMPLDGLALGDAINITKGSGTGANKVAIRARYTKSRTDVVS